MTDKVTRILPHVVHDNILNFAFFFLLYLLPYYLLSFLF